MVVREERGLWREQNIHDRYNKCKLERSKSRASVPGLWRRCIELDVATEKVGDVKGKVRRKSSSEWKVSSAVMD
jgi:hypothetical protein